MSATKQIAPEWENLRSRGMDGARAQSVLPASIRDNDRSFECVATTEIPALMWDWERYERIDEILVAAGGEIPPSIVLLRNHNRSDLIDIVGSAREFRLEENKQWACRSYLAEQVDAAQQTNAYWSLIKGGHLRAVSIGYSVLDYVDIAAGEKKLVGGRYYTAKARRLRVSTAWKAHELSLTPIGADEAALIRSTGPAAVPVNGFRVSDPKPKRDYFR